MFVGREHIQVELSASTSATTNLTTTYNLIEAHTFGEEQRK